MIGFRLLILGGMLAGSTLPDRPVAPGGVATVFVEIECGGPDATYRVEPRPEIRWMGPLTGRAICPQGAAALLPVTFGIPADQLAGPLEAAQITVTRSDGGRDVIVVRVQVDVRRRLELVVPDVITPSPGARTDLEYTLINRGNDADTVQLAIEGDLDWAAIPGQLLPVVLQPGQRILSRIRLDVPDDARPGESRRVRLVATGLGATVRRRTHIIVTAEPGWGAGAAQLPATMFVGTRRGPGDTESGYGVALHANGRIARETDVWIDLRLRTANVEHPALRSALSGPQLQATFRRPTWDATVGDVFSPEPVLGGTFISGRGAAATWHGDGLSAEAVAARPAVGSGDAGDGHSVRAHVGLDTGPGEVRLTAASVDMGRANTGNAARSQTVSIDFDRAGDVHRLRVSAGVLRIEDEAAVAAGPALDVRYALNASALSVNTRVRLVPDAAAGPTGGGNELYAGATAHLVGPVSADGWVSQLDSRLLGGGTRTHQAGSAGLRLSRGRSALELRARYDASVYLARTEERSAEVNFHTAAGAFWLDAAVELGRSSFDNAPSASFQSHRLTASWQARHGWAWFGFTHHQGDRGAAGPRATAGGALRLSGVTLEAGVNGPLEPRRIATEAAGWMTGTFRVSHATELVVGTEYSGWRSAASPWSFAIGIQRRLSVPLPLPPVSGLHGRVFEDADGNGRLDQGERTLEGVRLMLGPMPMVTDEKGRFSAPAVTGSDLAVEPASLPDGMLVIMNGTPPADGRFDVPVIRPGSLDGQVSLAVTGGGLDRVQRTPAAFAVLSLFDRDGNRREVGADAQGSVRVSGLAPGNYTVRFDGVPKVDRIADTPVQTVEIRAGETTTLAYDVPWAARLIRTSDGRILGAEPSPLPSADIDAEPATLLPPPDTLLPDTATASAPRVTARSIPRDESQSRPDLRPVHGSPTASIAPAGAGSHTVTAIRSRPAHDDNVTGRCDEWRRLSGPGHPASTSRHDRCRTPEHRCRPGDPAWRSQ